MKTFSVKQVALASALFIAWIAPIQKASASNCMPDAMDELPAGVGSLPMATWAVSEPYINLWVAATPLKYNTAAGSQIQMTVSYAQRNARDHTLLFGFGPGWEFSWLSYVQYRQDPYNGIVVE